MSTQEARREIYFILFTFVLLGVFAFGLLTSLFYQTKEIHTISSMIYNHPLQVSNAASNLKTEILKIHRNMNEFSLHPSEKELYKLSENTKKHEEHISQYMSVIEKNILGDEGKALAKNAEKFLKEWTKVRNEVVVLIGKNQIEKAKSLRSSRNMESMLQLEISISNIYEYAQNKAIGFKKASDTTYENFERTEYLTIGMFLFLFLFMTYYTLQRISKYINKNEHLRGVLAVIRDVNQLIVRQKDKQKLIQECCDILTSNHVFENAWIGLFDSNNKIAFMAGSDIEKDFILMQEKIKSEWTPYCIKKTVHNGNNHSHIENTDIECLACPLVGSHGGHGAFNIVLRYDGHIYGYLTLSLEKKYLQYSDEMVLLEEVAGDIAYALYNIDAEKKIADIKELYVNTINSVENLIFVKDTNFTYIACNNAFEKFVGKTNNEIVGKSDYEIFDKEVADFFRGHDAKMLADKKTRTNFEWVTYPDGKKVYLLTVKSPLINSKGEIIGLVGNSTDITVKKELEDSLKYAKARYEQAERIGHVGSWEYLIDTKEFWGSDEAKRIYGFESESDVFTVETVEGCIPEREQVHQALEDLLTKGKEYNLEFEIHPYDKGPAKIITSIAEVEYDERDIPTRVQGFIQDITQRKQTEQELKVSNVKLAEKSKEFETILKEAPNPIMLHNEAGEVLFINRAWEELSGYKYSEINTIDKWIEQAHAEEKFAIKEHINTLYKLTSRGDKSEYKITTKNRDVIIWQFSSAPLGIIDKKRVVVSSAMDITELKKKDEFMIAQSRHAAMGEMIGMIAHQWRQPLSVVSMIANNMILDVALGEFDDTKAQEASNQILEQTKHLSHTIDDFRNFFKPDKDVAKVKMENIINETFSIVKDSLVNNHIEFKILNQSESEIYAYPRELMQVFVNIISNAKDALVLKKGKDAYIEVTIYEDEKYVYTQICDNGGKIDEDVLPKIFDPYFTTKDEKTGTGLGLYMSKMIVEDHLHGSIEVLNIDNGVCFTIKLLKELQGVVSGQ